MADQIVPSARVPFSKLQQDHDLEAKVFRICAKAQVSCIGIQRGFGIARDFVLFQPSVTTLAVPLAVFDNPDKAIECINAKLAQSGFAGAR